MARAKFFGVRNLPHISMDAFRVVENYAARRQGPRKSKRQDHFAHSEQLRAQLEIAFSARDFEVDSRRKLEGLKLGTVLELETQAPIASSRAKAVKIPANLDFPSQEIVTLRTERHTDRTESAILFVPDDARDFLRDRITNYGRDPVGDRRPDIDRFEVIERITAVPASALFTTQVDMTWEVSTWWEIWVQGAALADQLAALARERRLDVHAERLRFPETTVMFIHANARSVEEFAEHVPGAISEIRRSTGTIEPFLERGSVGQQEWVADLADRIIVPPEGAPVVCALDTGVAAAHPLLQPGLMGAWSYDEAWGSDDHYDAGGHGTAIVSLVLYGDLETRFSEVLPLELTHFAESMKLLPPPSYPATAPPSYGVVTQGAVSQVEIARPVSLRSFCLATSAPDFPPSRPSSWSGALDQIASGSMPGDAVEGLSAAHTSKRLLLVATGNVQGGPREEVQRLEPLEDPSQSWNALTIGGFTSKEQIPPPPPVLQLVVEANHRSPYSRGSHNLPDDLTPIKPEVLFEAGNMLADSGGYCGSHEAVSLLAAGSSFLVEPLVPFWATSAAVGMAGNFIGRLQAALPDHWPETHRALTVDSASWPQPIRQRMIGRGAHWRTGSKSAKQQIVREVGYGVPDLERAIRSARNDISLIAEAEIQPFALTEDGRAVFNEMHFYDLPWPRSALQALENEVVTMKVTLSYFIEPNLTVRAATRPHTYRSFGLRFEMKDRNETKEAFRRRINALQSSEVETTKRETSHWLLGSRSMQAGSLHCDLWRGHAVQLASHDAIAVFPVTGWWKTHGGQKRQEDRGRYSLVISISAPSQPVDLHTEVTNLIQVQAIEV